MQTRETARTALSAQLLLLQPPLPPPPMLTAAVAAGLAAWRCCFCFCAQGTVC